VGYNKKTTDTVEVLETTIEMSRKLKWKKNSLYCLEKNAVFGGGLGGPQAGGDKKKWPGEEGRKGKVKSRSRRADSKRVR